MKRLTLSFILMFGVGVLSFVNDSVSIGTANAQPAKRRTTTTASPSAATPAAAKQEIDPWRIDEILLDSVLDLHYPAYGIDDAGFEFLGGFLGFDLECQNILVAFLGDLHLIIYDRRIDEYGLIEQYGIDLPSHTDLELEVHPSAGLPQLPVEMRSALAGRSDHRSYVMSAVSDECRTFGVQCRDHQFPLLTVRNVLAGLGIYDLEQEIRLIGMEAVLFVAFHRAGQSELGHAPNVKDLAPPCLLEPLSHTLRQRFGCGDYLLDAEALEIHILGHEHRHTVYERRQTYDECLIA